MLDELIIAAGDPLGAEFVNRNRTALEDAGVSIRTSEITPAGYGLLIAKGGTKILHFEARGA